MATGREHVHTLPGGPLRRSVRRRFSLASSLRCDRPSRCGRLGGNKRSRLSLFGDAKRALVCACGGWCVRAAAGGNLIQDS